MKTATLTTLDDGAMKNIKSSWRLSNFSERIGNKVQQFVGTRSSAQSRSHAQKVLAKNYYSKSSSADFTPRDDLQEENEIFEEVVNKDLELQNSMNAQESGIIKMPIGSPK